MKKNLIVPILLLGLWSLLSISDPSKTEMVFVPSEDGVASVLMELGYSNISHFPDMSIPGVSVKAGEELFKYGITERPNGRDTKMQSKHFVCTSCHNVERESPDLTIIDPQARLEYTHKKGLPFLQGSTMFGAVNRETFYNDDYIKRYGDLVIPAREDIRGAIQLCAKECAKGRKLKLWEQESILAYLWTLEIKMEDLSLSANEKTFIKDALDEESDRDEAVSLLKSKFMQRSPAHFVDPPVDRKIGTFSVSNSENGKLIYENSCLHCHGDKRYSYLLLDNSKLTFKYLKNKAPKYNRKSLYHVVRYGVESFSGKKSYMPKYPIEKLDVQQLDDLRTYIEQRADE